MSAELKGERKNGSLRNVECGLWQLWWEMMKADHQSDFLRLQNNCKNYFSFLIARLLPFMIPPVTFFFLLLHGGVWSVANTFSATVREEMRFLFLRRWCLTQNVIFTWRHQTTLGRRLLPHQILPSRSQVCDIWISYRRLQPVNVFQENTADVSCTTIAIK